MRELFFPRKRKDIDSLYAEAESLLRQHKYAEALKCAEALLKISKGHEGALAIKVNALLWLERHDEALATVEEVLSREPNHFMAWFEKANLLKVLQQDDEAEVCCRKALLCAEDFLKNHKNDLNALMIKMHCLFRFMKYDDALLCAEKILVLDEKNTDVFLVKARSLMELARYEDAILCADELLKNNEKDVEALFIKANSLSCLMRYEDSLACAEKALAINETHAEALFVKAYSLMKLTRYEEAIACADELLKTDEKDVDVLFIKASSLRCLSRFEEAVLCAEKVLAINEKHADALFIRADVLLYLERDEETLKCVEELLMIEPESIDALYLKAVSLKMLTRCGEAVLCAEEILKLEMKHVNAWFVKADALRMLEKYEEGLTSAVEGLKIDAEHVELWFVKGECCRLLGRREDAIICFHQSLALDPNYLLARRSLEDIEAEQDIQSSHSQMQSQLLEKEKEEDDEKMGDDKKMKDDEEAIVSDMNACYALCLKSDEQLHSDDFQKALISAEKAIEFDANSGWAWRLKSGAQRGLGSYEEALVSVKKALEVDSDSDWAEHLKGDLQRRLRERKNALKLAENVNVVGGGEMEEVSPEVILVKNTDLSEVSDANNGLQSKSSSTQNGSTQSEVLLNEQKQDDQDCDEKLKATNINDCCGRFFRLWESGDHQEALVCVDAGLKIYSKSVKLLSIKSGALRKQYRYSEALECAELGLAIDSKNLALCRIKASALSGLGRYEEALASAEEGLRLDSKSVELWRVKADSLRMLHRYEESVVSASSGLESDWRNQGCLFVKASSLEMLGRYGEAIVPLHQILEIDEKDDDAWCHKGEVFYKLGEYDESIKCFARAIVLRNYSVRSLIGKAKVLFCLKNYGESLDCFNRASEINPDNVSLVVLQGKAVCNLREKNEESERILEEISVASVNLPKVLQAGLWISRGDLFFAINEYGRAREAFVRACAVDPSDFYANKRLADLRVIMGEENQGAQEQEQEQQAQSPRQNVAEPLPPKDKEEEDERPVAHASQPQQKSGEKDEVKVKEPVVLDNKAEKKDAVEICGVHIQLEEIKFNEKEDTYYTADTINVLVCCQMRRQNNLSIYVEPAAYEPLDAGTYFQGIIENIESCNTDYAFIPLCVSYDSSCPRARNHWVAIIVDKRNERERIFYLDPAARKTEIPNCVMRLKAELKYSAEIIQNPIDLQQYEKNEGFVRHCGAYVVEIFNTFKAAIEKGKNIKSDEEVADENEINVRALLSNIFCGEAENISVIRQRHLVEIRSAMQQALSNDVQGALDAELDHSMKEGDGVVCVAEKRSVSDTASAEEWYQKGFSLGKRGSYDEAIKCAEAALKVNPNFDSAQVLKKNLLVILEKYYEAFDFLPEVRLGHEWCLTQKGYVLLYFHLYDESLKCFQEALKIDSGYVSALLGKGVLYFSKGEKQKSECLFAEAEARVSEQNSKTLRSIYLWTQRGELFFAMKFFHEAQVAFEKAQLIDSADVYIKKRLADLRAIMGEKKNGDEEKEQERQAQSHSQYVAKPVPPKDKEEENASPVAKDSQMQQKRDENIPAEVTAFEKIKADVQKQYQHDASAKLLAPESKQSAPTPSRSSLECIRPAPRKKSGCLFVVYPIMGGGKELTIFLNNLNRAILDDENLAVYLWRSPILTMNCEAETFKEEWQAMCHMQKQAEEAIRGIKVVQPHGPYILCGWSYGGSLALEIARQLRVQREEIKYIGLIDPQTPARLRSLDQRMLKNRLLQHINYISSLLLTELLEEKFITLDSVESSGIELIHDAFREAFERLEDYCENAGYSKLKKTLWALYANYLAIYGYKPEELFKDNRLSAITVFVARQVAENLPEPEYHLNDFAEIAEVKLDEPFVEDANHYDIVKTNQMANLFIRDIKHIDEIKMVNQFWLALKRHYQKPDFSGLQFLYDDVPFDVRQCDVAASSSSGKKPQTLFPHGSGVQNVLIIGKVGVGKTVLCRQLTLNSFDTQSKIWEQEKWVFCIPLKDLPRYMDHKEYPLSRTNSAIESMLYHCIFKLFGKTFEQVAAFWKYIKKEPQKICFILDGLDEVIDITALKNVFEVIFRLNTSVVVATREYQQSQLRELGFKADQTFCVKEHEGFSLAENFIPNYFAAVDKFEPGKARLGELLLAWLKGFTLMQEFCRIPLHLTMLCSIWNRFKSDEMDEVVRQKKSVIDIFHLCVKNMFRRFLDHQHMVALIELNGLPDAAIDEMTQHVSAFLSRCAFERIVSGSRTLTSQSMNALLQAVHAERNFFTKVLASGFISAASYAQRDIDRDFYFVNTSLELYFACQFVVKVLNSDNDLEKTEQEKFKAFIQLVSDKYALELLKELLIDQLTPNGKSRFIILSGEGIGSVEKVSVVTQVVEALRADAIMGNIFESNVAAVSLEVPLEMRELIYCFTSDFSRVYAVNGKKDRPDVDSRKMEIFKQKLLKQLHPELIRAVREDRELTCVGYQGNEGVLHYAVRRESVGLLKCLLTLDPNIELRNDKKESPIDVARTLNFKEGSQLLSDAAKRKKLREKIKENYLGDWLKGKDNQFEEYYSDAVLSLVAGAKPFLTCREDFHSELCCAAQQYITQLPAAVESIVAEERCLNHDELRQFLGDALNKYRNEKLSDKSLCGQQLKRFLFDLLENYYTIEIDAKVEEEFRQSPRLAAFIEFFPAVQQEIIESQEMLPVESVEAEPAESFMEEREYERPDL